MFDEGRETFEVYIYLDGSVPYVDVTAREWLDGHGIRHEGQFLSLKAQIPVNKIFPLSQVRGVTELTTLAPYGSMIIGPSVPPSILPTLEPLEPGVRICPPPPRPSIENNKYPCVGHKLEALVVEWEEDPGKYQGGTDRRWVYADLNEDDRATRQGVRDWFTRNNCWHDWSGRTYYALVPINKILELSRVDGVGAVFADWSVASYRQQCIPGPADSYNIHPWTCMVLTEEQNCGLIEPGESLPPWWSLRDP